MENNGTVSGETIIGSELTFTSTNTYMNIGPKTTIESFEFKETSDGNFIEVIKRQMPNQNMQLLVWPPREASPRVWKEIYGVYFKEDGTQELQLLKTIEAEVTPAHQVEESVEFKE